MTVGILVQGNLQDSNIEQHSDFFRPFHGYFFCEININVYNGYKIFLDE